MIVYGVVMMSKKSRKLRIEERLQYYHNKRRSGEGDTLYFLHKQQSVIPNLKTALSRIYYKLGNMCIDCGLEIGKERLEIVPGAIRCVSCQHIYEQSKVQFKLNV